MTLRMSALALALMSVGVGSVACRRSSPDAPSEAARDAEASPSSSASVAAASDASASSAASAPSLPELAVPAASSQASPAAGPAPSGSATPADRQRALASLLSGEWKAAELPEVATPPKRPFDPELRKRLTTVTKEVLVADEPRRPVDGPRATVQVGAVTSTTPIANSDRVVAGLRPRFRQCFQQGLNMDPGMAGKLVIVAKVTPTGEVASADVQVNTGLSSAVAACATRVVRNAQFAPPNDATTISIPVVFVPEK